MYIDSHAHIFLEEYKSDLDTIVFEALSQKVTTIYMPNIDSSTIDDLHSVDSRFDSCRAMMGLHPCYVKENYKEELKIVKDWLGKRSYAAVGEVGVDLYWDKTFAEQQIEAFGFQIELAKEHDLGVIIHSRDSLDVTISEIEKRQDGNLRGIFHCFNGTLEQGRKIVDMGFYLGIGGVVTFKNAGVDKVVKDLPLRKMVLETDAPYLTPAPHRGTRNEVKYIPIIAQKLSDIMEVSIEEVAKITSFNCDEIFK